MSLLILMKFFSALFDTSPGLNRSEFLLRVIQKKKRRYMYCTIYLVMHLRFLMFFKALGIDGGGGIVPVVLKHFSDFTKF